VEHESFLDSLAIPFVIDHMGRIAAGEGIAQEPFKRLLGLLLRNGLAWVKVSGAERVSTALGDFTDALPFAAALIAAAPERVLWGTDWPHPNVRVMPDDGSLVDLIPRIARDEALRDMLLVNNPTRLYW